MQIRPQHAGSSAWGDHGAGGMAQWRDVANSLTQGTPAHMVCPGCRWHGREPETTPVHRSGILIYRKMAFRRMWPSPQHGLPGAPWQACVRRMPCSARKHMCPSTPPSVLASSLHPALHTCLWIQFGIFTATWTLEKLSQSPFGNEVSVFLGESSAPACCEPSPARGSCSPAQAPRCCPGPRTSVTCEGSRSPLPGAKCGDTCPGLTQA